MISYYCKIINYLYRLLTSCILESFLNKEKESLMGSVIISNLMASYLNIINYSNRQTEINISSTENVTNDWLQQHNSFLIERHSWLDHLKTIKSLGKDIVTSPTSSPKNPFNNLKASVDVKQFYIHKIESLLLLINKNFNNDTIKSVLNKFDILLLYQKDQDFIAVYLLYLFLSNQYEEAIKLILDNHPSLILVDIGKQFNISV